MFFWGVKITRDGVLKIGDSVKSVNFQKISINSPDSEINMPDITDVIDSFDEEIIDDTFQNFEWEKILKSSFEKNIENWSSYNKISEPVKFGNDDSCTDSIKGDDDFIDYQRLSEKGSIYKLALPYKISFYYTPNYKHWSADKFLSFTENDKRICGVAWPSQVYAYPDKVLWGDFSTGGVDEDYGNKVDFVSNLTNEYFFNKK